MTVGELIKKLKEYPEHMEVHVRLHPLCVDKVVEVTTGKFSENKTFVKINSDTTKEWKW